MVADGVPVLENGAVLLVLLFVVLFFLQAARAIITVAADSNISFFIIEKFDGANIVLLL